jgi:hypothetical protein
MVGVGTRTDLIVWRDLSNGAAVPCGPPTIGPTTDAAIVVFNEAEDPFEPDVGLPALATARIRVGTGLATPFNAGWIYLDLERLGSPGGYVTSLQFFSSGGAAMRGVDLTAGEPFPE